jgi:hypothetical protein
MVRSKRRGTNNEKADSTSGASINNLCLVIVLFPSDCGGMKFIIPVLISY